MTRINNPQKLRAMHVTRLSVLVASLALTTSAHADTARVDPNDPLGLNRAACAAHLAVGAFSDFERRCAHGAALAALRTADQSEVAYDALSGGTAAPKGKRGKVRKVKGSPESTARLAEAVRTAEAAYQAHPTEPTQRALWLHLSRKLVDSAAARAGGDLPPSVRWPLPDARLPAPELPPLNDALINDVEAALTRATERRRDIRSRVDSAAPDSLRAALDRVNEEHALMLRKVVAAYEEALEKDPNFPKSAWLRLAAAYLQQDQSLAMEARPARALKLLGRLIQVAPQDTASSLARIWLSAFEWARGATEPAAESLAEATVLDPSYAALLEGLLAWRRGEPSAVLAAIGPAVEARDLATRAQALALQADAFEATGKPGEAALLWRRLADALGEPEEAAARANASAREVRAWQMAVETGVAPERVPTAARDAVTWSLLRVGRGDLAASTYLARIATEPTRADLLGAGLALEAELVRLGRDAEADALLLEIIRGFAVPGQFQTVHATDGLALAAKNAIAPRLVERVTGPIDAGQPLDDALRSRLGPLVEARLTLFPESGDPLETAHRLGAVGFSDRAAVLLKQVRTSDRLESRRLGAGRALVSMYLARARAAGRDGVALGDFFDGAPAARGPMPAEVRSYVDAQLWLLQALPAGPERDALLIDHLHARSPFSSPEELEGLDALIDQLPAVVDRAPETPLALRAAGALVTRVKPERAARDAVRMARRRIGPPEWDTSLRAALAALPVTQGADPAAQLLGQRLFDRAAQTYAELGARSADPSVRLQAAVAEAVVWTLALRVHEATKAWTHIATTSPDAPYGPLARHALATLYLASDQRSAARTALDAIATRDPDRAVEALSQLCDLDREHPQRLKQWTERLARLPGEDARVQAARIEVARAQNVLPVPARSTPTPAPTPRTGAPFYRFAPR